MANRSQRNQQRDIDLIFTAKVEDGGGVFGFCLALAEFGRNAIEAGGLVANTAVLHHLIEPIDRQKSINVVRMGRCFVPGEVVGVER